MMGMTMLGMIYVRHLNSRGSDRWSAGGRLSWPYGDLVPVIIWPKSGCLLFRSYGSRFLPNGNCWGWFNLFTTIIFRYDRGAD